VAVIYMKHPKHGTKVSISDEEAKADEKNGWQRFTLPGLVRTAAVMAEKSATDEPSRAELNVLYKAKFGKDPHHKRSDEWVRGELAAFGPFANRA
jgi:hypothetical protein